jgi:hypothetical protein
LKFQLILKIYKKETKCTRCVRNSEDFCIVQKARVGVGRRECEYFSHGVPEGVVWTRASEMIEVVQLRNRRALPLPVLKMDVEVKEGENLKPSDCVPSM